MASNNGPPLLTQAQTAYHSGEFAIAVELYAQILEQDPTNLTALNMAGAAAWQDGKGALAESLLRRAIDQHPDHPQAYSTLGVVLESEGRYADAVEAYQAALTHTPDQATVRMNLANALSSLGRADDAVAAYDAVLCQAPDDPDALNNKAVTLKDAGRLDAAETVLRTAVARHPDFERAWTNLGLVRRLKGDVEGAFTAYRRALEIEPQSLQALNNLGVLLRWQGELDEAEDLFQRILRRAPNSIEVLNNLGDVLQALNRLDEAESAFRRVLALDQNHPEGHHNLAVLLLLRGDFENGWRHYEWRWLAKEFPSERRDFPQPLWAGEPLADASILLYVEQGLGDALQFARYVPIVAAQAERVVVECPAVLKRLFENLDGAIDVIARGDPLPPVDLQCPFLSLPGLLTPSLDSIPGNVPYLHANAADTATWKERLEPLDGLKVGLAWAGSPHHTNDRERSIRLDALAPLADIDGCSLISLQIGDSAAQLDAADLALYDLTADIRDYADTAALIANLDLVITVDTSIAHAAGALGRPVWVLLPHAPDWRWLVERDDSPWYPNMTLYRQPARRAWAPVIERVRADLARHAGA